MLFLANKLSKMKQGTRLGSRIAEIHNGSSLFTGSAGQGESNIRRWDQRSAEDVNRGRKSSKFKTGLHDLPFLPLDDI